MSKIQVEPGSAIYYDPWLTSDPGPAFRIAPDPTSPVILPTLKVLATNAAGTTDRRQLLLQALEYRLANRHQDAIAIYKLLLTDALDSDEAMFALIELGNVYREIRDRGVLIYIESFTRGVEPFSGSGA